MIQLPRITERGDKGEVGLSSRERTNFRRSVEVSSFFQLCELIDVFNHRRAGRLEECAKISFRLGIFHGGECSEFVGKTIPDVARKWEVVNFDEFRVFECV